MAQVILDSFEESLEAVELIPSGGGVFEVTVGDQLVYSKKATGRHAEPPEVIEAVGAILA